MSERIEFVLDETGDVGAALRRRREASGRTLRQIADTTKLGIRTLDALERNQVEKLPPGIFYRAVVRAYANEVGLDPEQTLRVFLARHPDDLPPPGPPVGPVADGHQPAVERSRWILVGVVIGVAAAILLVMVWWWVSRSSGAQAPAQRPLASVRASPSWIRR